jgi:hypothetical protein
MRARGLESARLPSDSSVQPSALQTSSMPTDAEAGFQAQLVAWRIREDSSRQCAPGSGGRKQSRAAARRAQSHDIPRAPNPFADPNPFATANGDHGPPKPSGDSAFPNPFAEERLRRDPSGSHTAAALGAAPGEAGGSGEAAALPPPPPFAAAKTLHDAAEQAVQQSQQQQLPPNQPQRQQQQEPLQVMRSMTPKMQPEDSARSPLDQYFQSTASISLPSSDCLANGRFGLTDVAALSDISRVSRHSFLHTSCCWTEV